MERFVKGDIVVVPFPFSDLTHAKRRPAFVVTELDGNDIILCQITSKTIRDNYSIAVSEIDFKQGGLKKPSNVRPIVCSPQIGQLYSIRLEDLRRRK